MTDPAERVVQQEATLPVGIYDLVVRLRRAGSTYGYLNTEAADAIEDLHSRLRAALAATGEAGRTTEPAPTAAEPAIKVGDRVRWGSESSPHFGIVRQVMREPNPQPLLHIEWDDGDESHIDADRLSVVDHSEPEGPT